MENKNIRLTQTVKKGGCAAKIAASTLREVLSSLKLPNKHPNLLVSSDSFDDAGVYKINDDIACVETLDFFTPIVDSPFKFGKIAAVNALSDVYAMGGSPKTCLAILAFPLTTLDNDVMREIMSGACEAITEASALLVGGHSIDDDTLKFGISVTGHVHPQKIWDNANAKVGDDLILTKALGTGTLCAGLKKGVYSENDIEEALNSMMTLNRIDDLLNDSLLDSIHSATDITGFGLLGHSMQMAQASNASFQFSLEDMPLLPKALDSIKAGNLTKAHRTNNEYTTPHTNIESDLDKDMINLLRDPQTSGGLLLSIDPKHSEQFLESIKTRFPYAKKIGKVLNKKELNLYVS